MDTLHTDKLEAALAELQAEKERRVAAKVAAGTAVAVQIPISVISVATPEDIEENSEAIERAKAAELAKAKLEHGDCEIIPEFILVLTGVPRHPDFGKWSAAPDGENEATIQGLNGDADDGASTDADEAQQVFDNEESLDNPTPVYVRTTIRNGDHDGDLGEIVEGHYIVEGGTLVLTDLDGVQITSRVLLGEDPATLARRLLREAREPSDFNGPIAYPKLGNF